MRKKKILIFLMAFLSFSLLLSVRTKSFALSNDDDNGIPYKTYTLGVNGLIPTQTAYIPVGTLGDNLALSKASDLYFYNNSIYIANTSSNNILQITTSGEVLKTYTSTEFKAPKGVFVTDDAIYVADESAKKVFKIKHETNDADIANNSIIELVVEKPTSPLFGNNEFSPSKIAVKSNGNMYIAGLGSNNGIIEINYLGEFLGFIGINNVTKTLRETIYDLFVKGSTAAKKPSAPTNVALGEKGSILTTNPKNVHETFKRLNITGINTLPGSTFYPAIDPADITMSDNNFIYLVGQMGEVYEFDSKGNLLFYFDTRDESQTKILGLTNRPSGIVVDNNGNLYILDSQNGNIQVYQKTVFVELVQAAVTLYNEGRYIESKSLWKEILKENSSFALAHTALGSALSKEGDYDAALKEFKIAEDYGGYSSTYWEIRNQAIQKNLPLWCGLIILFVILIIIFVKLYQKSAIFNPVKDFFKKLKSKKLISELLYGLNIIKHPLDTFYGIKKQKKASVLSATIILIIFVLIYLIDIYFSGFLFRSAQSVSSVFSQLFTILGIFFLFIIVNYFVSTLSDGEGWLKDIYMAACYSLVPFIILTLPMTLLTHVLTFNEAFIVSLYDNIVLVWTLILLFQSIKEIHNYSFWKTVFSTLIIIFGMVLLVVIGLLVYSFLGQLVEFIVGIVREVIYRAA